MISDLKILRLKGKDIFPYLNDLAKLRIQVFREYPYLYEGDFDYENKYLSKYVACENSSIVLILDNNKVVGASTAIPLEFEVKECQQPFLEHNMSVKDIFYFGESILLPEYRGRNLYKHFFAGREAAAKEYGAKMTTFCAVERDPNDIRRPKDYKPLDKIWERFGYQKHPELCAYYEWKEIGESNMTPKLLIFWLKNL